MIPSVEHTTMALNTTMTPDSEAITIEDTQKDPSVRALRGLDAVNFFLADVRDGLGPYLAIYLISVRGPAQGWNEATAGTVMTVAGIVGLIATTPIGWLIDLTHYKRAVIAVGAVLITVSCIVLPWASYNFYLVAVTQSAAAISATAFAPALAAISLGIVGPARFSRRVGRNEGFNHAGNAFSAGLTAGLAHVYGPVIVFWLIGALAVVSIACILVVPGREIDNRVGRGLVDIEHRRRRLRPAGFKVLLTDRRLFLLAVLAALFHLANAAMLPTVGELLTREAGPNMATTLMAVCIVAAQLVMVPTALLTGKFTDRVGRKPFFLLAFGVLTVRGCLYNAWHNRYYLLCVQLLDGIGAGIYGALFPVIVGDLTRGTGHFNIAQGAVATAQGLGASLSATMAGNIIVHVGYRAAFFTLAGIAAFGFVIFALFMPETKPRLDSSDPVDEVPEISQIATVK
ncbi:MFS general substrate transporter [Apiospora arundinis]